MKVPRIKPNPELPDAPIAPDDYRVKFLSASLQYGKYSGTPYVRMKAQILTNGPFIGKSTWVCYAYKIPGLPSSEEECKTFTPVEGRVRIRKQEYNGQLYTDAFILGVGHD